MVARADQRPRALGFWMCTALVVGNMVGCIFLLPATLAPYGIISIVGWILTSLGAICLALVFAKLAPLVPKSGGPYAFCAMAELVILLRDTERFRGQWLFGSGAIAAVAFVYSVWTVIGSGAQIVRYGVILPLLGIPVYVWMHRENAEETRLATIRARPED